MSAKKHYEPYKQLRLPPLPPPVIKAKQPLKKTVSVPQAALNRLLGHQRRDGAEEEVRGEGKEEGKAVGRRIKGKRNIEVGEDVLTTEPLPPSPGPAVIPEGNLIDFDTDDTSSSNSASASSLLSCPPPVRSMSTSGRPFPSLRRPPPPPPNRVRLATVSVGLGGPVIISGSPKARPVPPPKPAYLSSPSSEQPESSSVSEADEDPKIENGIKPEPKPRIKAPSPYLVFTPQKGKPKVASNQQISAASSSSDSPPDSLPPTPPSPRMFEAIKAPTVIQSRPVTFPSPPPREMEYTEREHSRNVFEYLNKMRHRGDLCDVTLIASSREIRAHKAVLAACSQYFESMFIGEFSEPDGEPIIIEEVEDDALEALVNFSYTSRIRLTDRNIYLIFAAADLLQFSGVRGACFKFFKQQMNKSNCIRTWLFADGHNCTELLDAALKYLECNFLDIVRGREFLSVDRADVIAKLLALEDIAVTREEQVYEAALSWLRHNPEVYT